jgi:periplasmic protein TonB
MFERTLLQTQPRRGLISIGWIIEALLMALLVLIPLVRVQDLPQALPGEVLVAPAPPMGAPKPPRVSTVARAALHQSMLAPTFIPKIISPLAGSTQAALPAPALGAMNAVPWGDRNGALSGINIGSPLPPPPPARTSKPALLRLRVGGQVEGAKLIFQVKPDYPEIARMARIQGTVRLEAVISKEGTVASLKVVSGPPLLMKAAFGAVSQWRYQPTLLNGEPVEVATEIEVNFTLGE